VVLKEVVMIFCRANADYFCKILIAAMQQR